jgi:predicted ATP-grasp superfamily ATP-dependent carboligase
VPKGSYVQRQIDGIAGSISFVADGQTPVTLGLSRQLVGEASFGAYGFAYCGSLLATTATPLFPRQEELLERAAAAADCITREFGLVGLNGIDFIARNGVPYPIEVNPRYSASMELIERSHRISLFRVHADACHGFLPATPHPATSVHGKAIVFARHDIVLGNTQPWLDYEWLADIPRPSEAIRRGRPICTVFAEGPDEKTCRRILGNRAREVYRFVQGGRSRVA